MTIPKGWAAAPFKGTVCAKGGHVGRARLRLLKSGCPACGNKRQKPLIVSTLKNPVFGLNRVRLAQHTSSDGALCGWVKDALREAREVGACTEAGQGARGG